VPIRAEDLPLAVRKKLGVHVPSKKSRAGVGDSAPCPIRCVACETEFPTYKAAESHAHVEGHVRLEVVL
jgi:hypothetical protein